MKAVQAPLHRSGDTDTLGLPLSVRPTSNQIGQPIKEVYDQQVMKKNNQLKSILTGLGTMLLLTALLFVLFRDHAEVLGDAVIRLGLLGTLALAAAGLWYHVFDVLICFNLIRPVLPGFTISQAIDVTFLGIFGNVSTLAVGTLPMQSWYLHQCGLAVGRSVGLLTLEYVLHKSSVLLFAAVMLSWQWRWLSEAVPLLSPYIIGGFAVCLAVIAALILLCVWEKAAQCALWLLGKLPDHGKWAKRRNHLRYQVEALHRASRSTLRDKQLVLRVLALNAVKLFGLYGIPVLCMKLLGISGPNLLHTELLTALMYLISNSLPNIAGMGPTEFAFLTLYTPLLGEAKAAAVLLFYRISTYYIPFLVSVPVFLHAQKKRKTEKHHQTEEP